MAWWERRINQTGEQGIDTTNNSWWSKRYDPNLDTRSQVVAPVQQIQIPQAPTPEVKPNLFQKIGNALDPSIEGSLGQRFWSGVGGNVLVGVQKKVVQPIADQLNPKVDNSLSQKFWMSKGGDFLVATQKKGETYKPVQIVDLQSKVRGGATKFVVSIPESIANSFYNLVTGRSIVDAGFTAGTDIRTGAILDPKVYFSNLGKIGGTILDAYIVGGLIKGIVKPLAKNAGKVFGESTLTKMAEATAQNPGFWRVATKAGIQGGKLGTAFGLLRGLEAGRDIEDNKDYFADLALTTVGSGMMGFGVGFSLGAINYGVDKAVNHLFVSKTGTFTMKATPDEVEANVKKGGYENTQLGQDMLVAAKYARQNGTDVGFQAYSLKQSPGGKIIGEDKVAKLFGAKNPAFEMTAIDRGGLYNFRSMPGTTSQNGMVYRFVEVPRNAPNFTGDVTPINTLLLPASNTSTNTAPGVVPSTPQASVTSNISAVTKPTEPIVPAVAKAVTEGAPKTRTIAQSVEDLLFNGKSSIRTTPELDEVIEKTRLPDVVEEYKNEIKPIVDSLPEPKEGTTRVFASVGNLTSSDISEGNFSKIDWANKSLEGAYQYRVNSKEGFVIADVPNDVAVKAEGIKGDIGYIRLYGKLLPEYVKFSKPNTAQKKTEPKVETKDTQKIVEPKKYRSAEDFVNSQMESVDISSSNKVIKSPKIKKDSKLDPRNFESPEDYIRAHGKPVYSVEKTPMPTFKSPNRYRARYTTDAGFISRDEYTHKYYPVLGHGTKEQIPLGEFKTLNEAKSAIEAKVRAQLIEEWNKAHSPAVNPNKKAQKVPSGRGDVGGYATREEELKKIYGESFSKIKPIEMPELVQLAKELTGRTPTVTKRGLRSALGKAYTKSLATLDITLRPDIFKTDFGGSFYDKEGMPEDIIVDESLKEQKIARLVLAHEIGHITDALPEGTLSRGNELGRIGTLRGFLRETFSDPETEAKIDKLIKELKENQAKRRALRDPVLDENGEPVIVNKRIKYEITDKEADNRLLSEVKRINKEIEKLQENAIKNSDIRRELKEWTQYWKPFDENAVSDAFRKYRYSSAELYADAISGLFNAPATLKEKAPIFWDALFKFLNRKPKVEEAFNRLQDLINQEGDELYKRRDELINKAYKDAEAKFTAKELEKAQRKSRIWMDIKMLLDSKNAFVNAKVDQAIREGKNILDENNPKYLLEELQYIDAYVKNKIEELFQPVKDKAELVPDGWVQLGKILQLTRAITERGDMANPGGYDARTATDQLNYLKRSMPEKDWNILKEAQEDFRKAQQEIVNIAEKNKFWNPKTIESMKANRDYATFQVIDYLDTYITPAVKRQQGTLKDIANPATSSVIKAINVLRAIERNNAKRETIDFFIKNFGDELEKAPTKWNGKFHEVVTKNKPGFEMVKIVRDGKLEGYYVDPYIAKSLNTANDVTIKALSELMRIVSGASFYRPLFTSINLGFQTYNLSKDFIRYWKNLPDRTLGEAIRSFPRAVGFYKKAVKPSWDAATGQRNELIREMERMKILGLTYNDIYKNPDPEDAQIDRTLQKIGLAKPKNNKKGVAKVAVNLLNGIEILGDFIERLPKVAGYMQLKGQMSEKELAHFVRTKLGSPNFREGGTLTPVTNSMFLFSNAIKEGIKTDVGVATDPQTRSGYWWKTFIVNILPKLLMVASSYGIFGEKVKDIMGKASEYDKTNYTIIPLGEDENGKAVYARLPQDESGRLVSAVIWKFLNSGNRNELKFSDLAEVFSVFAGNVPSLAPNFTAFAAIVQYLSGNNPYDAFRGRNIISDDAFAAGVKYSLPELVNWLIKNNGGGIIIPNYTPGDTDMTALEKTLNMPVLSNIIGRWIKVSNYGETERLREISDDIRSKAAVERIEINKSIEDAYEKYKKSDKSDSAYNEIATRLIEDVIGKPANEMKGDEITKANVILKALNRYIIKGRADPKVNALLFARSNDEKAELLVSILKEMNREEATDFIKQMLEEKIITNDVLSKYAEVAQ